MTNDEHTVAPGESPTTVGVSIAVPEPYATTLQSVRSHAGDPLADTVPPHITLLPPTPVDAAGKHALVAHLRRVAATWQPFTVMLRGTGTFRPLSPVVFAMVAIGIPMCERLQEDVRGGPVERDLQFNYHPHVTVAHNVDDPALDRAFDELANYTCEFEVTGFGLAEQVDDGCWRPVERFTFGRQVH